MFDRTDHDIFLNLNADTKEYYLIQGLVVSVVLALLPNPNK